MRGRTMYLYLLIHMHQHINNHTYSYKFIQITFQIRFLKAFGNLHLSNTCTANTHDWKEKFSIKYYLITFSLNPTLFSAFSARPDHAFPTVFSTQYPRNGNGWAWGRGCFRTIFQHMLCIQGYYNNTH